MKEIIRDPQFSLLDHSISLPRMISVYQKFDDAHLTDPVGALAEELGKPHAVELLNKVKKGDSVAIGCGSRGISHMVPFLTYLVQLLKDKGASPFLFPAMGSHGGATAEGQREILAGYGITEAAIGAPVRSDMRTVMIGLTEDGRETYMDANAYGADHIIALNRIKAHTAFQGPYESGLVKMLVIGMGKIRGAQKCHEEGFGAMAQNIQVFAKTVLKNAPILMGIGLVENAYDETCRIAVLPPEKIFEEEPGLLLYAKSRMGRIKFPSCDLLIVDRLGKDISGEGMDPNVTGRFPTDLCTSTFDAQKMAVLDITDASHGNCYGLGLAELTTERLIDKSDIYSMYINAITNTVFDGIRIPMICKNQKEAIEIGISTCVGIDKSNPRIIRISDTRDLEHIMVSEAYMSEIESNQGLEIISDLEPLKFNEEGNLFS